MAPVMNLIRRYFAWVRSLDREPEPCPALPVAYHPANSVTMPLPAYRPTLLDAVRAYVEDDNARRAQLAEFGHERLGV